jgi:hypothetical protein
MDCFPSFKWPAVQIWIFQRNPNKRTKSTSYWKYSYNCPKMVHVGLYSVGTYHKKFGGQNKKIQIFFAECPQKTLGKDSLCRVPAMWHSAKKLLCRVPAGGPRQRLTDVSCRRPLTDLCREPSLPSVWHSAKESLPSVPLSVNELFTERRTLPSVALGKVFCAECPIKSTRQRLRHSAKGRIPVVRGKLKKHFKA